MSKTYFVISTSEDGDVSMDSMDEATLRQRLKENYWGNEPEFLDIGRGVHDLSAKSGLYIIKGEFVIPQPRQVAVDWEL